VQGRQLDVGESGSCHCHRGATSAQLGSTSRYGRVITTVARTAAWQSVADVHVADRDLPLGACPAVLEQMNTQLGLVAEPSARHLSGVGMDRRLSAILGPVRLISADRASVELRIARYQFPHI